MRVYATRAHVFSLQVDFIANKNTIVVLFLVFYVQIYFFYPIFCQKIGVNVTRWGFKWVILMIHSHY